jgi:hypothetical protein
MLELLYRVNAEVDVAALDDIIELRQLPEVVELALEASGRPLRVLAGETARLSSRMYRSGLGDALVRPAKLLVSKPAGFFGRRPLVQDESPDFTEPVCWGASRPMRRFETLLTVADMGVVVVVVVVVADSML